ncbi:MAG TPA: endonuclease/exonuclease/phosphatase family protein [Candidatus Kapabacteria bacterium]|nr:endonuclease/exonuclease/phosphatase family protein [Candidatus Kapabacteria bacterium]
MRHIIIIIILLSLVNSCTTEDNNNNNSNELIIGTFNLQWLGDGYYDKLPRNDNDYRMIADAIGDLNADILGVQEIENTYALDNILQYLPNYTYKFGEIEGKQNVAVLYKQSIEVTSVESYKPLQVIQGKTRSGLIITAKKGNFDFIGMIVHLKSTSRYDSTNELKAESYRIRGLQAQVLKNWADSVANNSTEKDILLLGDFNDNPTKKNNVLYPIIENNSYLFLSQDLISCANSNWDCIDHIAVNKTAILRYLQGSIFMYDIRSKYEDYIIDKLSDHCPVICKFDTSLPDND